MDLGLTVGFDADDTLWHNEDAFAQAEDLFADLVSPWVDATTAANALVERERQRVEIYGYGVKAFCLAMIATACDLSHGEIDARSLQRFVETADHLLTMPTVLIDGVTEVLEQLSASHRSLIITKGDLHHQMRRIDAADVSRFCFDVEVVAHKDPKTYSRILNRHRIDPTRFVMIGNSVVSDIAPVLQLGASAIHIPYATTWALETAESDPPVSPRWTRVDSIEQVPAIVDAIASELHRSGGSWPHGSTPDPSGR